ncbi:MAG TPA: 6-phosphogluconolactonase [Azonexus sp.]|nr:6-phosphogluconolactonase [Azonexus sp.]
MLPTETRILADAEAVAAEACRLISAAAAEAIARRQVFRLVLAGGSTPGRTYELLAATKQTWAAWEIFWGDERCLPADDPARNSRMAQTRWLDRVPIPAGQIHPIPTELGVVPAAAEYAEVILNKQPFDLVLLGMGEDGHTASLFPGAEEQTAPVIAVYGAPKPPAARVSLNFQTLRACREQVILVTGAEKAAALTAWRQGKNLPIARAVRSDACLLLDALASQSAT